MTIFIGLQGEKGVGKTTTAELIANELRTSLYSVKVASFAEQVYQIASVITGESVDGIKKNKNAAYVGIGSVPYVFNGMTRREVLQKVGTEVFRNSFDEDIWLSIFLAKYEYSAYDYVIVDDNRFQNEANKMHLTIRLVREMNNEVDLHSSENQSLTCDMVFNLDESTIEKITSFILENT